ncbi:hypothetical protein BT93_F2159 [Corymbia citriodora subsp. variegata]|nr:hypothetical protein BT93_F2159 [Corymbia citriodora subsp. variegata]
MNTSIKVEVQKDGGASLNNASATARTVEQRDLAEVYEAARKLANVIKGANVEDIISTIETLACRADSSAVFNFRGLSRGSLLHVAASTGKSNILRLLLDRVDADLIAAEDDWGNTPLHIATKFKAFGVIGMLICQARDLPNADDKSHLLRMKNRQGNTALHEAVLTRDVQLVRHLLGEDLESAYLMNKDKKSPLYLALDTGKPEIFQILLSLSLDPSRIEGLPPVHGAVTREQYDLVTKIIDRDMKLFAMTDAGGGNVFHLAAFLNEPRVLKFLRPETEYLARVQDKNGDLPIHIASKKGHVALIEKLHPVSHSVNKQGQTVLHVAAKYGRASAVKYILRHPDLGQMINERDHDGNTPSHLAAKYLQPAGLIHLVLDPRINSSLLNHDHLAATDIARNHSQRGLRRGLARMLLLSVSAKRPDRFLLNPEARDKAHVSGSLPTPNEVRDSINTLLVVAALVTTVTFTAGFAVPGGLNGSDTASKDDRGMATLLDDRLFQAFVICNSIAMICSMTSVAVFMLAYVTEFHLSMFGCQLAGGLLGISLPIMSAAFSIGVTLTIGKLPWLATAILILGSIFVLVIIGVLLSPAVLASTLVFPFFFRQLRPIRPLVSRFMLSYLHFLQVGTHLLEDSKEDRTRSETSTSPPVHGGSED